MELRSVYESTWVNVRPSYDTLEAFYEDSLKMVEDLYKEVLSHYRTVSPEYITFGTFLSEYIWVVYTSGFSSAVVTKNYLALIEAYSNINFALPVWQLRDEFFSIRWNKVKNLIANIDKHIAVLDTVLLAKVYYGKDWQWFSSFKEDFLTSPETMQRLPYIGPVTKYHLARNLGFDCVKPDLHLKRLAEHFDMGSPLLMCSYLSGLYDERIGVIDLVLWYGASTWGTDILEAAHV